ncbi:hypothetical protein D3C86_1755330 [compost metagenome]
MYGGLSFDTGNVMVMTPSEPALQLTFSEAVVKVTGVGTSSEIVACSVHVETVSWITTM